MKEYRKEIIICLITLFITGGIIFFFNRSLQSEKKVSQTDLYKAIPDGSKVILQINRTSSLQHISEQDTVLKKLIEEQISSIYISLLQEYPDLSHSLLSFHPQGTLFYTSVTQKQNKEIEKLISRRWFPAYSPQNYEKNGLRFIYYPDTEGRFFGHFYANGLWVGGYSRKLLEEAALLYTEENPAMSVPSELLRKNVDINSPLNLYVREELIFPDSLSLKPVSWIGSDIFLSESHICLFSILPIPSIEKQAADSLATIFTEKINQLIPERSLQHELTKEEDDFFYLLCTQP